MVHKLPAQCAFHACVCIFRSSSEAAWDTKCAAIFGILGKFHVFNLVVLDSFTQASDRAAYLVRQYIHYNLYDRIRYCTALLYTLIE